MTGMPTKIVLHLGAHKTASTHLQKSIEAAGPFSGVAFRGPQHLRDPARSIAQRFGLTRLVVPDQTLTEVLTLANGKQRLVLSDENFAGGLQTGWGRVPIPIYPKAHDRVAVLAQRIALADGPALDLCLAVRDPASFLTSAFSQILHGKRVVLPEKFLAKNPVAAVDWVDYVARLRAARGVGTVTIWRYEDYGSVFGSVCNSLLGDDYGISPLAERSQRRLSQTALTAVLQAKADGLPNMVAQAAKMFPVTETDPPFTLFEGDELKRSLARYAAQWDAIAAMPGVTPLRA